MQASSVVVTSPVHPRLTRPQSVGGTPMRLIAIVCTVGILAACTRSDQPSEPTAAKYVDPQAVSTENTRLRADIDTSALQRLLATVPYSSRKVVRSSFELVPGEMRDLSFRDQTQNDLAAAVYQRNDRRVQEQSQVSAAQDAESRLTLWNRPVLLALAADTRLVPKNGVVVYRSGQWHYDVVLLGEDAVNVDGLDAGLRTIYAIRFHDGLQPRSRRVGKLQLQSSFSSRDPSGVNRLPRSWSTYLDAKLSEARHAAVRPVPGIGRLQAIDFVVVNR